MVRHVKFDADLSGLVGRAWEALRARHPDLPCVAFEPMPIDCVEQGFGALAIPGSQRPNGTCYADLTVLIGPGWLYSTKNRGFLILAHEAAHALDYARHGKVGGHDEIFAALVRELRLSAKRLTDGPRSGDYEPALTEVFLAEYAETVTALGVAWQELDAVSWVEQ